MTSEGIGMFLLSILSSYIINHYILIDVVNSYLLYKQFHRPKLGFLYILNCRTYFFLQTCLLYTKVIIIIGAYSILDFKITVCGQVHRHFFQFLEVNLFYCTSGLLNFINYIVCPSFILIHLQHFLFFSSPHYFFQPFYYYFVKEPCTLLEAIVKMLLDVWHQITTENTDLMS